MHQCCLPIHDALLSDVEVSQTSICSTRLLNILAKRTLNRASNPSVAQPQEGDYSFPFPSL